MRSRLRAGGLAAVAGAILAIAGNTLVLVAEPSAVDRETVSYPLSAGQFTAGQVWFALTQALMTVGVYTLARSGIVRAGRPARLCGLLATAGMALTVPGELLLIPVAGSNVDSGAASAASSVYGIAVLVADTGLVGLGALALRHRHWPARTAALPLALGLFQLAVVTPVSLSVGFASAASYAAIAVADLLTALIGTSLVRRSLTARPVQVPAGLIGS